MSGCGIQHMLYIINSNFYGAFDNYEKQGENITPEYAIFVYIPSHLQRLQAEIFPGIYNNGTNLQYEIHKDKLRKKEPLLPDFFYKTYIIKSVYKTMDENKLKNIINYKYKSFMLANEIFLESKKLLEQRFPNIKFVILNYQTEDAAQEELEMPFMFDVLEKEGFIIINSQDLIGRKFKNNSEDTTKDGYHPSESAFDAISTALTAKLKL